MSMQRHAQRLKLIPLAHQTNTSYGLNEGYLLIGQGVGAEGAVPVPLLLVPPVLSLWNLQHWTKGSTGCFCCHFAIFLLFLLCWNLTEYVYLSRRRADRRLTDVPSVGQTWEENVCIVTT